MIFYTKKVSASLAPGTEQFNSAHMEDILQTIEPYLKSISGQFILNGHCTQNTSQSGNMETGFFNTLADQKSAQANSIIAVKILSFGNNIDVKKQF